MSISHCSKADMMKLMEVLSIAKIDFESGTVKVPLDDINRGFEVKKEGKCARVLITP
jgi:Zn-dependent alcohol dehydrogenase